MGRKFRKNMVGYIKFPPSWGKITTITKILFYFRSPEEKQGCKFFSFCSPPLGTIGENIAAIRRFHSLRSFHQRLLKVGPLRGPDVICETRVLYKAFAPSGRRAKCDDTQGDALGYELLPLQGVGGYPCSFCPFRACGAIEFTSTAASGSPSTPLSPLPLLHPCLLPAYS